MAVIAVAAVLGALAAAGVPTAGAGVVAGVLLTLWAPGAALLLALGPLAPLRGPARHALAIPASLAVSSLLAVGADRLHLGLRPQVLTLASLLAIVVLLAIAMVRLHRARRPR